MHRVGAGETLAAIGKRYGAAPASIVAANNLPSGEAMEGDRLLIPVVDARGSSRQAGQGSGIAQPPAAPAARSSAAGRPPAAHQANAAATRQSAAQDAGDRGPHHSQIADRPGTLRIRLSNFRCLTLFRYCLFGKKGYSMGDCALTTGGLLNV